MVHVVVVVTMSNVYIEGTLKVETTTFIMY